MYSSHITDKYTGSRGSKSAKSRKTLDTSQTVPKHPISPTDGPSPQYCMTSSSPVTSGMTSLPANLNEMASFSGDCSDVTSQTTSITDQRDTPLTSSSVQTVVTCSEVAQPPPVEISGSPTRVTCFKPIASRPNSGTNRGTNPCPDNMTLTVPGNNLSLLTFIKHQILREINNAYSCI